MFVLSVSSSAACECAVVRVKAAMAGVGLVSGCFLQDHSAGCVTQQPELSALRGAVGPHKPAHAQPVTQQTQGVAHTPVLSGDHLHQVRYNPKTNATCNVMRAHLYLYVKLMPPLTKVFFFLLFEVEETAPLYLTNFNC